MEPTTPKKVGDRFATVAFWSGVAAFGWLLTFAVLRDKIPRHPLVDAFLALLPIAVILLIRWWILAVTDPVKADAPELYGYVENLGGSLFKAVATSYATVFSLSILLCGKPHSLYVDAFGVIATACVGGVATLSWRNVWNACRVLKVYRALRASRGKSL